MSRNEEFGRWCAINQAQFDEVVSKLGVNLTDVERDKALNYAYQVSKIANPSPGTDIAGFNMEKEIIRSSIISVYDERRSDYEAEMMLYWVFAIVAIVVLTILSWWMAIPFFMRYIHPCFCAFVLFAAYKQYLTYGQRQLGREISRTYLKTIQL